MKYPAIFLAAVFILFAVFQVPAQISERDQAIKFYLDGKDLEAILALEQVVKQKQYAADAEVINYLGLAYQNALDEKKARKMFEKAVKLEPNNSAYRSNLAYSYLLARQLNKSQQQAEKALALDPSKVSALFVLGVTDLWEGKVDSAMATADKMISIDPGWPGSYTLKADILMVKLGKVVLGGSPIRNEIGMMRQAVEVLETGVKNAKNPAIRKGIDEKLEGIKVFYDHYSKELPAPGSPPEPGVTPFKVLKKPQALYTPGARAAGIQGTVRVVVLLGADGRISHVLRLSSLGYGLDEQAEHAARQITFQPKMKDGKPVSTVVRIDYSFSIG